MNDPLGDWIQKDLEAAQPKSLIDRAYDLLTLKVSDNHECDDGGVHPNDYNAAVREWVKEYDASRITMIEEMVGDH